VEHSKSDKNYPDLAFTLSTTLPNNTNLPSAMGAPLVDCVTRLLQGLSAPQHQAEGCAADWNAAHAAIGSFADEHSTL
jgi:hypothetical protein